VNDLLQQAMQTLATQNDLTRAIFVFCASFLLYLLVAGWLAVALLHHDTLTPATLARLVLLAILAFAAATLLTHVISDPRPYLVEHTQPLTAVATDNGFPSDHTLLAAFLTASLWWIARRALPYFAAGTFVVMLARLGIEAHHTLDVLGSVLIVLVAALTVARIPLPAAWSSWRSGSPATPPG
jgi:membrane-associated phospholipid phosphatase